MVNAELKLYNQLYSTQTRTEHFKPMIGVVLEEIMNLNGAAVRHATFGEGTILDHIGNYMFIEFAEGKKEFLYPSAFCKHITVVDPKIAAFIKTEVADYLTSATAISENIRLQRIAMQNTRRENLQKAAVTAKARKKKAVKVENKT